MANKRKKNEFENNAVEAQDLEVESKLNDLSERINSFGSKRKDSDFVKNNQKTSKTEEEYDNTNETDIVFTNKPTKSRMDDPLFLDTMGRFSKKYGKFSMRVANQEKEDVYRRIPTGITSLDVHFGGGLLSGRVHTFYGPFSSMKTTISLKTLSNAQKYCRECFKLRKRCKCEEGFSEVRALFIDIENTFTAKFAKKLGVNVDNMIVSTPVSMEDTIDQVEEFIKTQMFDFIILDSLAAMASTKVIESEASQGIMGQEAQLINRGFKKWLAAYRELENHGKRGPTIIVLNQLKTKVGLVFGSPNYQPGGESNKFFSTTMILLERKNVEKIEDVAAIQNMKFTIEKSKQSIPRRDGTFKISLNEVSGKAENEIFDEDYLLETCTDPKYDLLEKRGKEYFIFDESLGTEKNQLEKKLVQNQQLCNKIREFIREELSKTVSKYEEESSEND